MQRDRRLPRSRTALHDQHLIERRTDHDVLLALDRRDDLAHLAGPFGADLGEHRIGDPARHLPFIGIVEVLVEIGRDLAVVEREPTAKRDAERVDRGRPIEGRRDRRAPVDDDRIVTVVLDVASSDVPAIGLVVDPPEEVTGTRIRQIGECVGDRHLDVLLGDLVGRSLGIDPREPFDHAVARGAREPEMGALLRQVREQITVEIVVWGGGHRGTTS